MNNIEKYKEDYKKLKKYGQALIYGFIYEHSKHPQCKKAYNELDEDKKELGKKYSFSIKYQSWYNESIRLIKQLMPERLDDFVSLYSANTKRKDISFSNYTISDSLRGIKVTKGYGDIVVEPIDAFNLFNQQLYIVASLDGCFESSLYNIKELLQAELFDSELDGAKELHKSGFFRASGALCGVILEKHFASVCASHNIKMKKSTPGINDFNEKLKESKVIDNKTHLLIQRLGAIRNMCDHNKKQEPTKDDIADLISGTDKVLHVVL